MNVDDLLNEIESLNVDQAVLKLNIHTLKNKLQDYKEAVEILRSALIDAYNAARVSNFDVNTEQIVYKASVALGHESVKKVLK